MNSKLKRQNSKFVLVAGALLFALCSVGNAQQRKTLPRIGFIDPAGTPASPTPGLEAFRQGLTDLGYIDGKNILIEARYAEARLDMIPALVNELVQEKVAVLIGFNNVVIGAAMKATKTIPIVMVSSIDPIAAGYVDSLARPGGNVTGFVRLARELNAKRVELLKEMLPRMSRVAILWDENGPGAVVAFKEYQTAVQAFKLSLQSLGVRGPNPDFDAALQAARSQRADALLLVGNPLVLLHLKRVLELATKSRLPSMTDDARYVDAGGLVSYGADQVDLHRRAAVYVDKILKGTKPAELPVEQPTKFELVISLKAAKQIGLTIPPNVLARADKVIK
jgi:putative ABC transport system substrate-binding protein